jgi:hypothetical protein
LLLLLLEQHELLLNKELLLHQRSLLLLLLHRPAQVLSAVRLFLFAQIARMVMRLWLLLLLQLHPLELRRPSGIAACSSEHACSVHERWRRSRHRRTAHQHVEGRRRMMRQQMQLLGPW